MASPTRNQPEMRELPHICKEFPDGTGGRTPFNGHPKLPEKRSRKEGCCVALLVPGGFCCPAHAFPRSPPCPEVRECSGRDSRFCCFLFTRGRIGECSTKERNLDPGCTCVDVVGFLISCWKQQCATNQTCRIRVCACNVASAKLCESLSRVGVCCDSVTCCWCCEHSHYHNRVQSVSLYSVFLLPPAFLRLSILRFPVGKKKTESVIDPPRLATLRLQIPVTERARRTVRDRHGIRTMKTTHTCHFIP